MTLANLSCSTLSIDNTSIPLGRRPPRRCGRGRGTRPASVARRSVVPAARPSGGACPSVASASLPGRAQPVRLCDYSFLSVGVPGVCPATIGGSASIPQDSKGGDAIWAPGWPLTLGERLVLHLGDVEALRLRLGRADCYCCVRPLRSLLASAERALAPDRLPLEAALFPCKAAGGCGCGCGARPRRPSVPVRDSAMQTCPLFEVAGSLPHIDSDDDDDVGVAAAPPVEAAAPPLQPPAHEDRSTSTDEECCPLVATPRSITEVPDRLLMAGITLPGTHDVKGRPLIMIDSQSVARASLDRHQVATLLLYYASIPTEERLSGGVCVLVASCGGGEAPSLELVDQALSLLAAAGGPYHVVSGEEALREFVAAEQAPAVCGGRCDHDQLEWVEFHKELEPLTAHAHACGRRLVAALQELRAGDPALASRRQLHAQQRLLARALADPELARLSADGAAALARLQQRAQWLPASQDVRLSLERAERLLTEVEMASRRLETLCDARRERLRDLARLRALQHESEQVLSWLCQKGEETLRRHSQLATSLPAIKEQENDFEKFYFISMRHLDKGSDLLEECSGEARGGGLRELARSLKTHLLGFSERLEDTRERLEDTSRCFCLLDKAYEWALETMKYVSRVKTGEAATAEQGLQLLRNLRQYLMAHPPIAEDHFHEMLALARKLANDKLLEQAKVAQARCQETMELIREQQTRLVRMRRDLGAEDADGDEALLLGLDQLVTAAVPTTGTSASSTTPCSSGRRRSLGAFPYIYKCSHHAEGRACSCCDPTPPPPDYASSATSGTGSGNSSTSGASASGSRLNGIREEEREGSEDGNKDEESSVSATIAEDECTRCDHQQTDHPQQFVGKRPLRRACTWQYPVESFEDEGVSCTGGDDKCGYSGGGSTTDGSDGCPKNAEDLEEHDNSSGSGSKPMPPVPVNSHLHCHTSNLNIQADSAKELKTQKTLLLIMREMIQTERDYVKSLEYVIQNYIPELLREDIPQALRGQRNVIFGNIEKIFEFHSQYFLQELERCENSPLLVGQSFLRHEKKFYLYALYNKNKPKSDSLMSEYGTSFFKGKQLELGDKMDLASYLLKPVQRMGKYALLLQQLMKAYPDKESEIADIRAAEQMVRFQLRHGNDLLAMDSLRDCDVNVKEQGRLLRQNEFLVWQGKGKKCLRHVFLFEELILFSKARRFPDRKNLDLYIYKNSIKMTDIGLTAKIGDSPTKFEIWFRKRKPNDTFTLQSMSEEIKQAWTEEISKLLWKQALRNREMRLAEMSSMGIGNKPCLDIRPSADQINDRSISIAQLSKTAPRFRNSITVAPGELSRNNKRPHSIISVSSSSSSAGSNSSHGTLHLGFESVDSPRAHHRSTTLHSQCSTESGIIADMSLGSEDADASHWHVERSNSSATSVSLDSSLSPVSPTEDLKTCLEGVQVKGQETTELQSPDSGVVPDEMSVKL
ncbi:puratrophin-1-like [Schistocerca cancellata]|uniref:puratrophin-1-like n=1 Tax=Schistocerca cancellata TaxID=274614 RepID=UPI002117613E|nr:puratrophin-1-like [Schistocerca cancellata]